GAYLVLFPRAKVLILNTIPPLWFILGFTFFAPAWLVLGFWFLVQNVMPALGELAGFGGSQVAFFAHLGGFILGLLLIRPLSWGRAVARVERWDGWRRPAPRQPAPFPAPQQARPQVRVVDVSPGRFDGRWGE
ncbi:MAG: rhomboid family intramembrane serine protease, partial [Polyangiaceae bacterium]